MMAVRDDVAKAIADKRLILFVVLAFPPVSICQPGINLWAT